MRVVTYLGAAILGLSALIVLPSAMFGQPGGKSSKGGRSFGFSSDPKVSFENLAKGRPYFLISESRLSNALGDFAKQKGITNGQITLPQYIEFTEQLKARFSGGGGTPPGGPSPGGGPGGFKGPFGGAPPGGGKSTPGVVMVPPPGVTVLSPQQQQNPDTLAIFADADFRRRDKNDDDVLNTSEMPSALRDSLAQWDKDKNELVSMLEFRAYFVAHLKGEIESERGSKGKKNAPIVIFEEENWDVRPTVLRAGKLHADLPSWFKELDFDIDGQVALHEWRQKKALDEFRSWDSNNDGFITQEEALKLKNAIAGNTSSSGKTSSSGRPSGGSGERPSFGSAGGPPGTGAFGDRFKKGGFGGFGGFGKKTK